MGDKILNQLFIYCYISCSNKLCLDVGRDRWDLHLSFCSLGVMEFPKSFTPKKVALNEEFFWCHCTDKMTKPLRMVYEIVKMYNFGHLLAKASSNANKTTWSLAHCAESWVPPFIRMFLFTDKKQFSSELYHVWLWYFCL